MGTGTTEALQKLALVDIQFHGTYDQTKMTQLVQALVTTETTVNALMQQIADLQSQINTNSGEVAKHVLATETGLGIDHTVSGLVPGQALVATSPTSAEFKALDISELGDVDAASFDDPSNGMVLEWLDGYLTLVEGSAEALNQSFLTMNNEQSTLPLSRRLVAGPNITLGNATPGELIVSATGGGTEAINDIDGGASLSIYLTLYQDLEAGFADTVFSLPPVDGGNA